MSSPDIATRLNALIREKTADRRRAKELEELTGIPATSWKNILSGKQRPTCHMIESAAKQWPEYAFWLATGLTDSKYGHSAPNTWGLHPCTYAPEPKAAAASTYFKLLQFLHYLIYGRSVAFDNYWVENKHPTEDEIREAEELRNDPTLKCLIPDDEDAGKIFKRKYRDLNDAVAELAERRWLEKQMAAFDLTGEDNREEREKLVKLIEAQEVERQKINDDQTE